MTELQAWPWLLYGANGYTGALIAREAVRRGMRPVLAGRGAEAERLARELELPFRRFGLDDPDKLDAEIRGHAAVLHCAGPFVRTSAPMADACLRTGTHYLDITGEIPVFLALAARDREAREAGVMLLPGVGFDVVPSDCLAAHLKRRLPSATSLVLAFQSSGGVSTGTATTMALNAGAGGAVRRDGRIVPVPAAWKSRMVDLGSGPRLAVTIPWGDVATAWHSTGIPNIEVCAVTSPARLRLLVATRYLGPVLRTGAVRALLTRLVRRTVRGPGAEARTRGRSRLWGEVRDDEGLSANARLIGPEGYTLTVRTALAVMERVLKGEAPAGFQTPSLAYGSDFILEIEGVTREDITSRPDAASP